jgi:ABC-type transport system involved in cytochrome bd biosynthesis fused ATPase/permease subunit
MNREIYIVVGLSIFAFLLGIQLKKRFAKKKPVVAQKIHKSQRSKVAKQAPESPKGKQSKHPKIKSFFNWLQVVVLFFIIIFMMPALSRDIMVADGDYDQKLILRILIVAFAAYTLFVGLNKLFKKKGKW